MARPVGSKNRKPSGIAIGRSLAAKGIDLAERILRLAEKAERTGDLRLARECYADLCKYSQVVPTTQPDEGDETVSPAIDLADEDLAQAAN